jgi:hypothetical protein
MWCVANLNEEYLAKMEEVLETYERPYDSQEPVLCLDEKPVTLHAEVRPASPAAPSREARYDNEYQRCGTANVFCAVEPKAGRHFTFPTPKRSGAEFAPVVCRLADQYSEATTIHLVMNNLNIHGRKSLTDFYGAETGSLIGDRFTVHYTPTHGSWLNQAEIEIGLFPASASVAEEFRAFGFSVRRAVPGIVGSTAPIPKLMGSSTAVRPAASLAIARTLLSGQRTSSR